MQPGTFASRNVEEVAAILYPYGMMFAGMQFYLLTLMIWAKHIIMRSVVVR